MTQDPFQTYQNPFQTPFGSPYMSLQNPLTGLNPIQGLQHGGISGGGIHPQLQLQLAALASQGGGQQWQQNPYTAWQNPLLTTILQNPMALQGLQGLQNPYQQQNPLQQQSPYLQQNPYQQQNPLLQNPLLLHSLLAQTTGGGYGATGFGQQIGQQNPFQQQNPYQQQNPFQQQNPYQQQNPLLQNPLLLHSLLTQTGGHGISPFGQIGQQSPFQQYGQFGQGLPPQTWIGQGAQFGGRPFFGISPWAGL
jgi:hypothetical protein